MLLAAAVWAAIAPGPAAGDTGTFACPALDVAFGGLPVRRPADPVVTPAPEPATLSDGLIAFAEDDEGGRARLWSHDPSTGTDTLVVELRRMSDAHVWIDDLAWSPDGRRLAFTVHTRGPGQPCGAAMLWDAVDGSVIDLLEAAPGAAPDLLAWSPDGTRLAFGMNDAVRDRGPVHAGRIEVIAAYGTGPVSLGGPSDAGWDRSFARPTTPLGPAIFAIAWSADGRRIAARSDAEAMWGVDLDPGVAPVSMPADVDTSVRPDSALSPDGDRQAVVVRDSVRILPIDEGTLSASSHRPEATWVNWAVGSQIAWQPSSR